MNIDKILTLKKIWSVCSTIQSLVNDIKDVGVSLQNLEPRTPFVQISSVKLNMFDFVNNESLMQTVKYTKDIVIV
jgi:hypothetical protein